MAARKVTARSTVGVPFIPPGALTELTSRLRASIGRLHRRLAPPPVQILEAALSLLEHRVLVALCDVRVFDVLDEATSMDQLAQLTGADPDRLDRLVRFAATRGWLKIDRRGDVRPTRTTTFLRADHPAGWRAWVDFVGGDHVVGAVAELEPTTSADGFRTANGKPFFAWLADHPDHGATFDAAMGAGARMHALTLDAALRWPSTGRVCDVGGGTGELLRTLLDRHPNWQGTVLDLPEVVERAIPHPRLSVIGGDAFEAVPGGHDTYLLVNVLHDWGDDDCVRLLRNLAAAAGPATRIVVVENLRRAKPQDDLALRADILMAALTAGGRERTTGQFGALARTAGLEVAQIHQLGSGDHALVLVLASSLPDPKASGRPG